MKAPLSSLGLSCPVLAAPMAGGATTPALVAAAARAGSLGFLAAGYKTPDLLRQQIAEVREQAPVFGVNVFAPNPVPVDPAEFRRYAAALQAEAGQYGLRLDEAIPVEDDDAWAAKVDLLAVLAGLSLEGGGVAAELGRIHRHRVRREHVHPEHRRLLADLGDLALQQLGGLVAGGQESQAAGPGGRGDQGRDRRSAGHRRRQHRARQAE